MKERLNDIKNKLIELWDMVDDDIIEETDELTEGYEDLNSLLHLRRDVDYWIDNIQMMLSNLK